MNTQNTKLDVTYEYTLRDVKNEYKTLKKHVFTSAADCRAFLQAKYDEMEPVDQSAAKADFDTMIDMVMDNFHDPYDPNDFKLGEPLVMPFCFEDRKNCHWIDITISLNPTEASFKESVCQCQTTK